MYFKMSQNKHNTAANSARNDNSFKYVQYFSENRESICLAHATVTCFIQQKIGNTSFLIYTSHFPVVMFRRMSSVPVKQFL